MSIKEKVNEGDRIRLIEMPNDPRPILPGSEGTVTYASDLKWSACPEGAYQIGVNWDGGRALSLTERDRWEIIA